MLLKVPEVFESACYYIYAFRHRHLRIKCTVTGVMAKRDRLQRSSVWATFFRRHIPVLWYNGPVHQSINRKGKDAFDLFGPLLGPLLIVIMVIVVFESCWRKCPPDKLMIVSGFGRTRSVSGKGTFVILGLQRVDTLALGAVQVQLSTEMKSRHKMRFLSMLALSQISRLDRLPN